ncbi:MAG: hypothetical protein OJF62_002629 [Pseudolabrys sp.]|jgi:TRAP transporter TAXI family solute receptor|nr:hypothetical protein [Pseudolabrys sp.]
MPGRRSKSGGDGASVTKAIAVLRAFVDGQNAWGVRELANALGQPGSSIHRLLQILRKDGIVEWDSESQKYRSGMELFRWAATLSRRFKLAEVAQPIMTELSSNLGESCWLGVYEPNRQAHAYVSEVLTDRPLNYTARIGSYEPLINTAAGRAITAYLNDEERNTVLGGGKDGRQDKNAVSAELRRIRINGYAVLPSQNEDVPVTIAAPILGADNRPVASLTLVVAPHRCPPKQIAAFGSAITRAAGRLSRLIGSQVLGAAGTGTWHQGVNVIANLIHREMPDVGSIVASRGGDGALRDLQAGLGAYCFAVAESLTAAYEGRSPFDRPYNRLRAMFSLFPLYLHVVVKKESGIRSFADLRGARISAGDRDFTTANVMLELLQLSGLARSRSVAEKRLVYLDYSEAHREFLENKLEAVVSLTGLDDPSYRELARRTDIRVLSVDRKLLNEFVTRHEDYEITSIPASTYAGSEAVVETVKVPTVMVTTSDRGNDEVRDALKAIYENQGELAGSIPGFGGFNPESIFRGVRIPLHPGAERFWIECGMIPQRQA